MDRGLVRFASLAALALTLAASLGSATVAQAAGSGGSGVITRDGRIGPLRIGASTEGEVIAFAGEPAKRDFVTDQDVQVLTYKCGSGCKVTYFVDSVTGILDNFGTSSRKFRTERGTRVGWSQAAAEKSEHRKARTGSCVPGLEITHGKIVTTVLIDVGERRPKVQTLAMSRIGSPASEC